MIRNLIYVNVSVSAIFWHVLFLSGTVIFSVTKTLTIYLFTLSFLSISAPLQNSRSMKDRVFGLSCSLLSSQCLQWCRGDSKHSKKYHLGWRHAWTRENVYSSFWKTILQESLLILHTFLSRGSNYLCSELSFQGCLNTEQLWKRWDLPPEQRGSWFTI